MKMSRRAHSAKRRALVVIHGHLATKGGRHYATLSLVAIKSLGHQVILKLDHPFTASHSVVIFYLNNLMTQ
jgi:redox-sensitive bicupin YhaK (pirin superfamily)